MSKNQRSCGKSCNCIMNPKVLTGCVPDKWWHCFGETSELDHDLSPIIYRWFSHRVQNSFWICFASGVGFFFGFLSRYHLPCICNSLELEPVILHGICYILAWSLCILHGICYIWPYLPSIVHGICHILAFQPLICMVFATFWCFKRSCGSLEGSLGFHLGFHLRFH